MPYSNICIFVCMIICIYGCMNTKIHCWDDKTRNGRGDGECMSIKSYEGWNRCVAPCGIETENKYNRGKSKPYEPKKWIRPRPYVYP